MVRSRRGCRALVLGGLLTLLSGCSSLGYYWQSISGHLELMRAAKPVEVWLADQSTPAELKAQLELAQQLRNFASSALHLPDNASYRSYAEIGRPAVVWTVVAAPELSLELRTWCFPVAGCVTYRGYFALAHAQSEAQRLRAEGLEVGLLPVPAYSTLGWLNWAGGDPLLSSFIGYREEELARLLFHELAHQVVYVGDDTTFNESFATAVERIGARQWRASRGLAPESVLAPLHYARRQEFRELVARSRRSLEVIYTLHRSDTIDRAQALASKQAAMQQFRADYASVRAGWQQAASAAGASDLAVAESLRLYDRWMQGANNAQLGAMASYDDMVPSFERLFARENDHWPRFYDAVRELARMPKQRRRELLQSIPEE